MVQSDALSVALVENGPRSLDGNNGDGAGLQSVVTGRFAPSPTGRMHAGNIYAALMAWLVAKAQGGEVVLRIEDLDQERSRQEHIDALMADFERLGLTWDHGPYFQSQRAEAYHEAFKELERRCGVYPCYCTRADLKAASAPHFGEKSVYPGTCRNLSAVELRERETWGRKPAWRLRVPDMKISFEDAVQGPYGQNLANDCGDFVIRRSDGAFAYQLAVVVDDADQGINSVVRGMDLLCSTPQQIFLQRQLGFAQPEYAHIPLLVAQENRRLSKRDHDAGMEELMGRYKTPEGILGHIAGVVGLAPTDEPASAEELLSAFSVDQLPTLFPDKVQIPWRQPEGDGGVNPRI